MIPMTQLVVYELIFVVTKQHIVQVSLFLLLLNSILFMSVLCYTSAMQYTKINSIPFHLTNLLKKVHDIFR